MRDQVPSHSALTSQSHRRFRETTDIQFALSSVGESEGIIDRPISGLVGAIQRHHMLDMTTFFQFFAADFVSLTMLNEVTHNSYMPMPYLLGRSKAMSLPGMEYLLLQSPMAKLKRERCSDLTYTCDEAKMAVSYLNHTALRPGGPLILTGHSGFVPGEEPIVEAGAASISKAFPTAFFLMVNYPCILLRVKDKIGTAFYQGNLSNPPQWRQTSKLRYLDAILKESMRYCPAIPFGLERVVPPGGIILEDRFIPEETLLECHIEALRNDRAVYGEDVEVFRPERWLTTDTQRRRRMEQGLLEFDISRRISPGVFVAWLELKKAAVLMILNFDVSELLKQ